MAQDGTGVPPRDSVTLENTSGAIVVINLPHEIVCTDERCCCSVGVHGVQDHDPKTGQRLVVGGRKRIAGSVTLLPKGQEGSVAYDLPPSVILAPDVRSRSADLKVTRLSPEETEKQAAARAAAAKKKADDAAAHAELAATAAEEQRAAEIAAVEAAAKHQAEEREAAKQRRLEAKAAPSGATAEEAAAKATAEAEAAAKADPKAELEDINLDEEDEAAPDRPTSPFDDTSTGRR